MNKSVEQIPMAGKNSFRVLIVDDLPINLFLLERLLKKLGYICEFAENGLKAMEKLEGKNFQLIFLDCEMPVMNGYEVIRKVRASDKHAELKIICTSVTRDATPRCKTCAVDGFLGKPVAKKYLEDCIAKFMSALT